MSMRPLGLILVLILIRPASSADVAAVPVAESEKLAAAFVSSLERDDLRELAALGVDLSDASKSFSVRSLFDKYEHIKADLLRTDVVRTGVDTLQADIEIAGSAEIIGPSSRRIVVARCWRLQMAPAGDKLQLTSALTREDWLAAELALAPREDLVKALADKHCIRVEPFLKSLADKASDRGAAGLQTIDWVEQIGREQRLASAQSTAARMRSAVQITESPAAALTSSHEALRISTGAHDAAGIVAGRFSVGVAYWFTGELDEAARWFRSTEEFLDETPEPHAVLQALYMAAYLDKDRKPLREVVENAERLLALLDRFESPRSRMDVEFLFSNAHDRLRNPRIAMKYAELGLESARLIGDVRVQAMALHNIAETHIALEELSEARPPLEEALSLTAADEVMRARMLSLRAKLLFLQKQTSAAQEGFSEAIALAKSTDDRFSEALGWQGQALIALERSAPEQARSEAQRALDLIHGEPGRIRAQESAPAWPVRITLGRALRALNRNGEAEQELRLAVAEIEESRLGAGEAVGRSGALEGMTSAYTELIELLVEQGRLSAALDVAESTKARALRDALSQGHVDRSSGLSVPERERETHLETELATVNRKLIAAGGAEMRAQLEPKLDAARTQLQQFRSELYLRHPRLSLARGEDPTDWGKVALSPDAVAVEFVVLAERTLAFIVQRKEEALVVDVVPIGISRTDLRNQVEDLADRIGRRDPQYKHQAAALHARIFGPIERLLQGKSAIVIVPDDVLWRLPVQALIDAVDTRLAETAIYRAPSLRALAAAMALPEPSKRPLRLLALGNPRVRESAGRRVQSFQPQVELGALPAAERETRAIARLYGRQRSAVLIGTAASESAIEKQAADFDVIHLATHGLLDDRAPIYSALVLASDPDNPAEDGLLEAREIADLSLSARLVVLSACDTGRGRVGAGEGLVGMSWAFMVAGVSTVVVSDWKTDSAATEKLMIEFHRQLLDGKRPAVALKLAQNLLRGDPRFAHPYYWAPFVVVGVGA